MSAIFGIGANIFSQISRLWPKPTAVVEAMGTPLEDYSNDTGTASPNVAWPATRVLTSEQPQHSHSQPPGVNVQDTDTTNQVPSTNEDYSSSLPSLHDSTPDLEAASSSASAAADNAGPERAHQPKTSELFRSKLLTAGAVLILGILPLIVLPGVIMGALTGQILMGIALSSAVATVVGVFAGCYYYIKKEG